MQYKNIRQTNLHRFFFTKRERIEQQTELSFGLLMRNDKLYMCCVKLFNKVSPYSIDYSLTIIILGNVP